MTKTTLICVAAVGVLGQGGLVEAREIQLTPSSSLRVVNPSDAADVRVLYRFTMPVEVQGAEVVRAFLTLPTKGVVEAPVTVGALEDGWVSEDTWSSLEAKLQSSDAFNGLDDQAVIACNWIEETGSGVEDSGIEVSVTKWVRSWAKGGQNHGLCVRRLPGRSDDLLDLFEVSMPAPILTVIYMPPGP